jgi:hypothetical protein
MSSLWKHISHANFPLTRNFTFVLTKFYIAVTDIKRCSIFSGVSSSNLTDMYRAVYLGIFRLSSAGALFVSKEVNSRAVCVSYESECTKHSDRTTSEDCDLSVACGEVGSSPSSLWPPRAAVLVSITSLRRFDGVTA